MMVCKNGINDMHRGWRIENELNERIYQCWHSMIVRCYNKKYQEKYTSYKGCYVCNKWLKLSGFIEDISKIEGYELWLNNPNKRICLDKDIKSDNNNKCYCLEECRFVTNEDNVRQSNKDMVIDYSSEEYRKKISKSKKGKNTKGKIAQYEYNKETKQQGELIKIWDYAKQVEEELGIDRASISRCCNGKQKTSDGYIWKYI